MIQFCFTHAAVVKRNLLIVNTVITNTNKLLTWGLGWLGLIDNFGIYLLAYVHAPWATYTSSDEVETNGHIGNRLFDV
jgi:hypothetical protein